MHEFFKKYLSGASRTVLLILMLGGLLLYASSSFMNYYKGMEAEKVNTAVVSQQDLIDAAKSCPDLSKVIHRDIADKSFNGLEPSYPITRKALETYLSKCKKIAKERADRELFYSQMEALDGPTPRLPEALIKPGSEVNKPNHDGKKSSGLLPLIW